MMLYVHPQFIWREGLRMVLAFGQERNLTVWNRRTVSGRNVLTLEPAPQQETRDDDTHSTIPA